MLHLLVHFTLKTHPILLKVLLPFSITSTVYEGSLLHPNVSHRQGWSKLNANMHRKLSSIFIF